MTERDALMFVAGVLIGLIAGITMCYVTSPLV